MAIDVVGSVLGVVLKDKNRRVGPKLAVRKIVNQTAYSEVIAGHE